MPSTVYLELRALSPQEGLTTVLRIFDSLEKGCAVQVIHDRDPLSLRQKLEQERPGLFRWEYVKRQVDEWRVSITKAGA